MSSTALGDRDTSVSVVVCTYTPRRLELLRAALARVRDQMAADDELVVVVDHDEELRARLVADEADACVIANDGRSGLAGARDAGIAAARGDLVAFLDDDAVPRPGWLEGLRGPFADGRVIAAGGAVEADWDGQRPRWFPDELGWIVGCDYRGLPGDGEPIRNPIGANMAVRRDALTAVGAFHGGLGREAELPMGCEETEMAIRIRQAFPDTTIVRVLGATVDHRVPRTRASLRYALRRSWYEGISKGRLTRTVGSADGLSSERRYALHTVSRGVVRHLSAVATRRDPAGAARAAVLVACTLTTAAGFLAGRR